MAIRSWGSDLQTDRRIALAALAAVRQGANLPSALASAGAGRLAPRERAFVRRLAGHALRHRRRIESEMQSYLSQTRPAPQLADLLWLGGAQLELADIADYAAVNSTVELAPKKLRGVVNAVLRRRLREPPSLPASPALRHSFPDWLAREIAQDWGQQAEAVMAALNLEPPLCLRVNARQGSVAEYGDQLRAAGIAFARLPGDALALDNSMALEDLPGFAAGQVSIQGAAAQLAAALIPTQPGQRVLDACAAPGGKTAHLLERQPTLQCLALDIDAERLNQVAAGLSRLGLTAELRCADAARGDAPDQPPLGEFDHILLDVPCSGSGVIGRHPDIKSLRRAADIPSLVAKQVALLDALWTRLRPGGVMLYCSCSVLSRENDGVIGEFVQRRPDAVAQALQLPVGQASAYGWRVPPDGRFEGFYYARLLKSPAPPER